MISLKITRAKFHLSVLRADGIFALEEFFQAAENVGVYLLARPGPYINLEVSGDGLPGWLKRQPGLLRNTNRGTPNEGKFVASTQKYIEHIGGATSKHEITCGSPVVLFQPENEYSRCLQGDSLGLDNSCLDKTYHETVLRQYRQAGVSVPFQANNLFPLGNFALGTGEGEVDIYGYDYYPFSFGGSCKSSTP